MEWYLRNRSDWHIKIQATFCASKPVLWIIHGNAVPARGFWVNKYLLSIHGNNLIESTLVALQLVKDELFCATIRGKNCETNC